MKNKEYLLHLLAEISNYILDSEPHRMVISLHQEPDGMHLAVMDDNKRPDEELEAMSKALNSSARPELAEYYGSMGGSDLLGTARLNIIGWQIKRADVGRIAEGTKIDLWLGSDRFDSSNFSIPKDE
ncbi:MAG: hypothetical protein KKI09_11260 [Spirochaetes bacterium]|nr:hypothetical protein [Spirochaetota bacterium]MBU0955995.1 hypothetical protein [Spirochaetota bacterium]